MEASNAIENITAPRRRIEELVAERTAPPDRSEAEIAGYRAVLGTIHASAADIQFTPKVVRQLHRDLYQYAAQPGGDWKCSEPRHRGAAGRNRGHPLHARVGVCDARDDGRAARRLGEGWAANHHHRLLFAAAYTLDFLAIHPFTDGNGRMSRLLSLLLLHKGGYDVGRFVSLEKLIEQSKETCYDALGHSTAGWHEGTHDPQPWLSYFLGILTAAYREFEPRAEAVTAGRGVEGRARESVRPLERQCLVHLRRRQARRTRRQRRVHPPGAPRASRRRRRRGHRRGTRRPVASLGQLLTGCGMRGMS